MSTQTTTQSAPKVRLILLFASAGLISGLVAVWMSNNAPSDWMFWLGVGLVFWLALAFGLTGAIGMRWIQMKISLIRGLLTAVILAAAFPLAFLIMLESTFLYNEIYRIVFTRQWQNRGTSPANEGIYIGLVIAAVVSALLISIGIQVLTRKWFSRGFYLMIIASISTVVISIVGNNLIGEMWGSSPGWDPVVLIVGQTLFGGVCGYWLLNNVPVGHAADGG